MTPLAYFTRHPTVANLLMVLLVGIGLVSLPNLRAQFFPDVVVDSMNVSVTWDGAGPEDVDSGVVQLLDPALLAVDGVTGTFARAREGRANITIEFAPGTDMARAEEDVTSAVAGVTALPAAADDPVIRAGRWFDPVTDVVISGPVGIEQLGLYADALTADLFQRGVTRTTISGYLAPEIRVEVATLDLIRHKLTLSEIARAIRAEVSSSPSGDLGGRTRVRTGAPTRTPADIAAIALRSTPGAELTVGDVARLTQGGPDRDRAFFVGPDPAVHIRISRTATGDAIALQEATQQAADALETTLPKGTTVTLVNTRADDISARLAMLTENGLQGLALVVGLLFLFLNARTAFWVAAGIPVAMLTAVSLMPWAGLTLNMISLFALIITLGIVVDDAIVVGEHADARHRAGEPPQIAATNAARRMIHPVFSATITTIIAFYGLTAIGGRFGEIISDIPFTVIAVLTASLIECFVILPHHLSLSVGKGGGWIDWPSRLVNRGFDWLRDRVFRRFIRGVIALRYPVMALTVVALASQVALVIKGDVTWRFFNAPEQSRVTGNFALLPGATRDDALQVSAELQRAAQAVSDRFAAEHGVAPVLHTLTQIGGTSGRGLAGADTKEPHQLGSITLELIDSDARPYGSSDIVSALQTEARGHPMIETLTFRRGFRGPGGSGIEVQLSGADASTLKSAAEALKDALAAFPEVSGLQDSLAYDKDELSLVLTPQGKALGLTVDGLAGTLRDTLAGVEAASFPVGARSATIRVDLPQAELTADFLSRFQLTTPTGAVVPLADVVSVTRTVGFSTVRRENGIMLVTVSGDLSENDPARAADIERTLQNALLPDIEARFGIATELAGQSAQERAFRTDTQRGLIMVLVGIYLTLTWIFGSWTRPLVIMSVIPFALIGTIWGHQVWDIPLSMFSVVGILGMVGIVINDSIVLVTTIDDHARTRGRKQAIIDGTADRLRAVFLTTATTVLGLLPLLYEGSVQAEFLKPTVVTLVYGLGAGMALVLVLVPALMAAQGDIGAALRGLRHAVHARPMHLRNTARLAVLAVVGSAAVGFGRVMADVGTLPQALALLGAGLAVGLLALMIGARASG